eukprot:1151913-Pelagomonas_calceolata.AAC.2
MRKDRCPLGLVVTMGFDLQPGDLAALPAQLFQPHKKYPMGSPCEYVRLRPPALGEGTGVAAQSVVMYRVCQVPARKSASKVVARVKRRHTGPKSLRGAGIARNFQEAPDPNRFFSSWWRGCTVFRPKLSCLVRKEKKRKTPQAVKNTPHIN